MKTRWLLLSLPLLLAGLLAACEPFETELTINEDGSGKLVQRVVLSPAAQAMLDDPRLTLKGYRPVLTEEEAEVWSSANENGVVKLLKFSSARLPDGWLRIETELIFIDLRALAESVWGYPLQLSVSREGDSVRLSFQEPASTILRACMERQNRAGSGTDAQLTAEQSQAAFLDLLRRAAPELSLRTKVNLPAGGVVEGGRTDEGGRAVTVERRLAAVKEWFSAAPVSVTWANRALKVAPFDVPKTLLVRRPLATAAPVLLTEKDGFSCQLQGITYNKNRRLSFRDRDDGEPQGIVSQHYDIRISVLGTQDIKAIEQNGFGEHRQPAQMLSALTDEQGRDLRTPDTNINFSLNRSFNYANRYEDYGGHENRFGNAGINLGWPDVPPTALKLLEGYVAFLNISDEETLEVRPIKEYLNKDLELPGQTLQFLSVSPEKVEYQIRRSERWGYNRMLSIRWFGATGQEVAVNDNPNGSGDQEGVVRYTQNFNKEAPFPVEGYAVVRCPAAVREYRIPFKFSDVKLP